VSENNSTFIYSEAVKAHFHHYSSYYLDKKSTRYGYIHDEILDITLPSSINESSLEFIDVYDKGSLSDLKPGINLVSLQPINLNGSKIEIVIINYFVSYKRGNYEFANGGGSKSIFEYSCEEKKWNLVQTIISGI